MTHTAAALHTLTEQRDAVGAAYTWAYKDWQALRLAGAHIVDSTMARIAADALMTAYSALDDAVRNVERVAAEER